MLKNDTHKIQSALAGYCRDGQPVELPGTTDGRVPQYRRLVFNVIKGTLDQAYPVAAKHLGVEKWNQLVHHFFAHHPCRDPQIWRMPRELIDYVKASEYYKKLQLPHLLDLLKMEWLEIEVHAMPDQKYGVAVEINDILHDPLCFNPHYRLERFDYPVHKIHTLNPGEHRGDYFLLIFREPTVKQRVQFIALQPAYAALIDSLLLNPGVSVYDMWTAIGSAPFPETNSSEYNILNQLFTHLLEKHFVLGRAII
jgi:hypothetical protein